MTITNLTSLKATERPAGLDLTTTTENHESIELSSYDTSEAIQKAARAIRHTKILYEISSDIIYKLNELLESNTQLADKLFNQVDYASWEIQYRGDDKTAETVSPVAIILWLNSVRNKVTRLNRQGNLTKVINAINGTLLKIFGGCWGVREKRDDDNIEGLKHILNVTISSALVEDDSLSLDRYAEDWTKKLNENPADNNLQQHYSTLIKHYASVNNDRIKKTCPAIFQDGRKISSIVESKVKTISEKYPQKDQLTDGILEAVEKDTSIEFVDPYVDSEEFEEDDHEYVQSPRNTIFIEPETESEREDESNPPSAYSSDGEGSRTPRNDFVPYSNREKNLLVEELKAQRHLSQEQAESLKKELAQFKEKANNAQKESNMYKERLDAEEKRKRRTQETLKKLNKAIGLSL